MGSIGIWQVLLILAIVLIIFGAGKLPRVMGDFGKGIKSFKTGMKEAEEEEARDEQSTQTARQIEQSSDRPMADSSTETTSRTDTSRTDRAANG
ncbi:MAG: twin-arginine translocase TatA/TatE family subunit [Azospirillaceae bacterium]